MSRTPIRMTIYHTPPNLNSGHLNSRVENGGTLLATLTLWIIPEEESLLAKVDLDVG
jgi:hypothetical protein